MPKVFVAENVSGLLKGTAKGFFLDILKELKVSGYNVKCKLLDAQWLGVPQMRQRAIFIGVRSDLKLDPVYPKPLSYQYSVKDALINSTEILKNSSYIKRWEKTEEVSCFTINASGCLVDDNGHIKDKDGKRKFTIAEVKKICSFPDDFILKGSYSQQWERLGNAVPPVMMFYIAKTIQTKILDKVNI